MLGLGCLGIILIWFATGLIEGIGIYLVWNLIVAALLSLPNIPFAWAFAIGLMLSLFSSSK